jgi:hypothetical protein
MAVKATENQIIQLEAKQGLKQQYEFAQSPSKDMATCSKIPWFPSKPMMKYLPYHNRPVYR